MIQTYSLNALKLKWIECLVKLHGGTSVDEGTLDLMDQECLAEICLHYFVKNIWLNEDSFCLLIFCVSVLSLEYCCFYQVSTCIDIFVLY